MVSSGKTVSRAAPFCPVCHPGGKTHHHTTWQLQSTRMSHTYPRTNSLHTEWIAIGPYFPGRAAQPPKKETRSQSENVCIMTHSANAMLEIKL